MLRFTGVLVTALALAGCTGERKTLPTELDPSSPQAAEAPPATAMTSLADGPPLAEEPADRAAPPAPESPPHGAHAGHGAPTPAPTVPGAQDAGTPSPRQAPQPAHGAHDADSPAAEDAGVTVYACPMHPEVTDTKPSRCPKCGMKLVPRKAPPPAAVGGADGGGAP